MNICQEEPGGGENKDKIQKLITMLNMALHCRIHENSHVLNESVAGSGIEGGGLPFKGCASGHDARGRRCLESGLRRFRGERGPAGARR